MLNTPLDTLDTQGNIIFVFTTSLGGEHHSYPHFTEKETRQKEITPSEITTVSRRHAALIPGSEDPLEEAMAIYSSILA